MKILLVDDSRSARYAMRLELQRYGIEVETADCAESAFETLKVQLPDAILMDHMMPGLNGLEALDVIRNDPRTAQIPVVMCTSHEDPDFATNAQKKGVIGILPKSVPTETREKLPQILDKLRDAIRVPASPAVTAEPTAAAVKPIPAAEPPLMAQPAGLSESDVIRLIDARLDTQLPKLLTPLLEGLRRDLSESLRAESRQLIEAALADERASRAPTPPPLTLADVQTAAGELLANRVPDLVRVEVAGERAQIMEHVEQQLQNSRATLHSGTAALNERLAALEEAITNKAVIAARRAAQEVIEASRGPGDHTADDVQASFGATMRRVYGLIAGTAVLGIGAAAAVYVLLR